LRSRLINLQMFIEFLHWGFGRAGIATIVHAELGPSSQRAKQRSGVGTVQH
jgi:hypothetical protein